MTVGDNGSPSGESEQSHGRRSEAEGAPQPKEQASGATIPPTRPPGFGKDEGHDLSRLSADLELPPPAEAQAADEPPQRAVPARPEEGTQGSGTRPEGNTQRETGNSRFEDSSSGDPLIGEVILDRYRILRRIGSGGMGSVYVGEQLAVRREVALKVLRPELLSNENVRQRFRREAEIIGRLSHPNTIQLIDYGETPNGLAVMVCELLRGLPLNDRLKSEGPMDLVEVLQLGEQVARSLAEAHHQGLVHRDLKPANIFLVDHGDGLFAKVLDFGIARLLDEEATRLTTTGQVFGTPRYMSPEQAISTARVDERSDLYSLGLILYEGLVGQPPFVAQTSLQYLSAHTTKTPPKLRENYPAAPEALEALIDACLEKDPENRPPSAEALADVLVAIRREFEGASLPPDGGLTERGGLSRGRESGSWTQQPSTWLRTTQRPGPKPDGEKGAPARRKPLMGLLLGGLLLLLGGSALAVWLSNTDLFGGRKPIVVALESPDADLSVLPEEEAPLRIEVATDAGADESPDAQTSGLDAEPTEVRPKPERERTRPRKREKKKVLNPLGRTVTQEPRSMLIPGGELEGPNFAERAKECSSSTWRGLARFSTRRCRDGCAIIIDEQCGGRTPARDRSISPGRRHVVVVCGRKVVWSGSLRFQKDETTQISCRR